MSGEGIFALLAARGLEIAQREQLKRCKSIALEIPQRDEIFWSRVARISNHIQYAGKPRRRRAASKIRETCSKLFVIMSELYKDGEQFSTYDAEAAAQLAGINLTRAQVSDALVRFRNEMKIEPIKKRKYYRMGSTHTVKVVHSGGQVVRVIP